MDTISTADKYLKVILYSDYTWEYMELPRPAINEAELMDEDWDNVVIHAYRDIDVSKMPDSVDLLLADDIHPFCLPIKGVITSHYGWRWKRPHRGVDINLNTGDSVRAAFDGVVRISEGTSRTGGYGNLIIVRHANGLETYYGHLSKLLVKENETVSAGEVIGLGGSTGHSTGPHLHFETRYMGKAFDPERVVDFEKGTLRSKELTIYKGYYDANSKYGNNNKTSTPVTQKAPATSSKQYHTVRQGDTLGKIAKKYHTTISKLCKLNKIKETTILSIGRKLRVK